MSKNYYDKSRREYDEDVSKRFDFQSQIQVTNPPSNPNWSSTQGQSIQPPSAPPPPSSVGPYVGPNIQPTNQYPRRDRCLECARCSVCFIMFGVFFVIVGIVTLSTASNFDAGPGWIGDRPPNPSRTIGPIALTLGISFLVLACIVITIAKSRVAANSQNAAHTLGNFGGPQPVISGRIDSGSEPSTLTYEYNDHWPHNHNPGSTSHHDDYHGSNFHHDDDHHRSISHHDDQYGLNSHHDDHLNSTVHSSHHESSSSHCNDQGTSSSTFDSPPSYDTATSGCDTGPSTTTD